MAAKSNSLATNFEKGGGGGGGGGGWGGGGGGKLQVTIISNRY